MEDNRKFATFFADAPKGKKIGAVLSWIATVILLVALFVPGYQLRYQIKTEKGTFKDIPATMTSELKQMKEAAKLNFQFGAGTTSDKIDEFVEKGSTSVFSYLVSPDLQKARLVNLGTMSDAPDDISKICVALLVLFFVLVVAAAVASVFTISWCALAANLIGIIELLAVYFFVFAGKFSIDPTDTSITSRVAPALTMILIVLLVLAAIMSVASVIVSYVVHQLMKSQEYSAAEEYLGKITEQQTDRLFLVNTHHPILDALFNTKAAEATQKKISIDFEVNDLSNLPFDASDIVVLLSNLLDNAIEACQRYDKGDKTIHVMAVAQQDFFISVRNTWC